jgi:hypothetical protein
VKVGLAVGVCEGVSVTGWKGVSEMVGVKVMLGVREAVGVWLPVAVGMLKVSVIVAVGGVLVGVAVGAFGSGANCTAIQPRQ